MKEWNQPVVWKRRKVRTGRRTGAIWGKLKPVPLSDSAYLSLASFNSGQKQASRPMVNMPWPEGALSHTRFEWCLLKASSRLPCAQRHVPGKEMSRSPSLLILHQRFSTG